MNHDHKYQKVKWGKKGTIIWRCMSSGCTHYVHDEMVEGRLSCCWGCGKLFVMTTSKMARVKPKCDECVGPPAEINVDQLIADLLQ